jgi:AcrR family transcriptional regulator
MSGQLRKQRWNTGMSVEARRDEILRTLGEFLRDRHLSSLKMQDIADRLGMTKGNLYYYFKSKRDILFHCHMKAMQRSLTALEEVQATQASPGDKLHTLLVRHVRSITDDTYSAVLLTDLEMLSQAQRRHYISLRDNFEHGVRSLIEDGIREGEFLPQDVRLAGFAILGAINWISRWYKTRGPSNAEDVATAFADFFCRGLRASAPRANVNAKSRCRPSN